MFGSTSRQVEVHTDSWVGYKHTHEEYAHKVVDRTGYYVKDGVHTNGLENFWCLLKRSIKGTYVHYAPFHLCRYVDEQSYRFNERKHEEGYQGWFIDAVKTIIGRWLPWDARRAKNKRSLMSLFRRLRTARYGESQPHLKPFSSLFPAIHFWFSFARTTALVFRRPFRLDWFFCGHDIDKKSVICQRKKGQAHVQALPWE